MQVLIGAGFGAVTVLIYFAAVALYDILSELRRINEHLDKTKIEKELDFLQKDSFASHVKDWLDDLQKEIRVSGYGIEQSVFGLGRRSDSN
jgi:hypothetical protein